MALVDELLQPIAGDSPSGADLRYTPVYDNIREARREDDNLNQGAWQRERKMADWPLAARTATEALKNRSKDLQIAAWLTEAWIHRDGFSGISQGLVLCRGLLENFWDSLYPELEDGDMELRAAPLDWVGTKLDATIRMVPISASGYGLYRYRESRKVQYEDQAKDNVSKKAREKLLAEGKLAPEVFDKDFSETPKSFYAGAEKNLDVSLGELGSLAAVCDQKFKNEGPSFGKLKTTLEELRHVIHSLLQKKRETDPDPVEEPAAIEPEVVAVQPAEEATGDAREGPTPVATGALTFSVGNSSESASRQALVAQVAAVAATLRAREPFNPAPYLMLRGLRWGELRAAAALADPNFLEAPPTEVRQHVKKLANAEKWKELLEVGEGAMALPCSRAWLDLQRLIVEALTALGSDYDPIAIAIRSDLRALVRDLPQLLHATLLDDTPAANDKTRAWLQSLLNEPLEIGKDAHKNGASGNGAGPLEPVTAFWQKRFVDSNALAKEALRSGQESRAFEILQTEISYQTSARGRFHRRLQFVELCLAAGKEAIAQPILEDLLAAIDAHKLEEWEDRSSIAGALVTIMKASKKIQGDAKEKQKYFERVCRLDPVQALSC